MTAECSSNEDLSQDLHIEMAVKILAIEGGGFQEDKVASKTLIEEAFL